MTSDGFASDPGRRRPVRLGQLREDLISDYPPAGPIFA
jgi:hypothetical protein